jgi:enoyl-CoA hydratase
MINPPVNALSPQLREDLVRKMDEIAHNPEIWSLIITGHGDKSFAAGADIPTLLSLDQKSGLKRVQKSRVFFNSIAFFEKPVIAAINGICLGGGLELALACDIRIAADHAKLGFPEVNLGLIPGGGGTQRLPRAIGPGWANYLLFTGETITAEKANEIGIVQDVIPYSELLKAAMNISKRINNKAPLAVRAVKKASHLGLQNSFEKGLDIENQAFSEVCATKDKNEGLTAFLEKRKPMFTGN